MNARIVKTYLLSLDHFFCMRVNRSAPFVLLTLDKKGPKLQKTLPTSYSHKILLTINLSIRNQLIRIVAVNNKINSSKKPKSKLAIKRLN